MLGTLIDLVLSIRQSAAELFIGGIYIVETWKTMELYPKYQVSTEGKIRNTETHQIYAQWLGKDGYLRMEMWLDGKKKGMLVHRMVTLCYLENPLNLPEVNHKNKIKSDNRVENLEWVTRQEIWTIVMRT